MFLRIYVRLVVVLVYVDGIMVCLYMGIGAEMGFVEPEGGYYEQAVVNECGSVG